MQAFQACDPGSNPGRRISKMLRCKICNQLGHSASQCPLATYKFFSSIGYNFSGSSPPEIFVGRHSYPYVYAGILSPAEYGDTERYSMPELWFREKATIKQIMEYRMKMIYSRFLINVKTARAMIAEKANKHIEVLQEIAMASRHVDASFELNKKPMPKAITKQYWPIIGNPASLKKVVIENNPKVERKVEYLVNDTDVKAEIAIKELYKANIEISNIIKLFNAGLLGLKLQRRLVPTRWAVTAVDSIASKQLIEKIKDYPQLDQFLLFHSSYLGNHYEIILIPDCWRFEVIEAKMPGCIWNADGQLFFASDYESFFGRKGYASNVTGAYYANRLAVAEYLASIKRQASCLVLREVRPEYNMPCGVGILRETTRDAFKRKPESFSSLEEALQAAQKRLQLPIGLFLKHSKLIKEVRLQKKLA